MRKRFAYGRTVIFGVLAIAISGAVIVLSGCSANKEKVQYFLEAEGCSQTQVGGWSLFGCSDSDNFVNTFQCTKNGKRVSGYVCSGWTKGYTVRYE